MVIDERSRKELYETLETTLGSRSADTMTSLLPPVGWADVATKHGLQREIQPAKQGLINTMTWRVFAMMTGYVVAMAGIVAAFVVPLYP